ncbi:response regulator transcription factor [Planococcus faecalis]|uniref:response regulator transcription factor n=1 Tax=Planococcus faecalis TaxID=1598147 RepID=UPI00115F83FB|nr:response regulator transcription factor [Planococcus faecalis]
MKHILIIEDDEKIQQFLHSILTEIDNSFYLHVSPSAAQALEIANTMRFPSFSLISN